MEIEIPPLRARGMVEIEQLAHHFADMYAQRYKRPAPELSSDAIAVLRAHTWPGNVRELEHWIESAVVLAPDGRIGTTHLPRTRRGPAPAAGASAAAGEGGVALPLGMTLEEATRRYVQATLDACDGNKADAARRLERSGGTPSGACSAATAIPAPPATSDALTGLKSSADRMAGGPRRFRVACAPS